jgi:hypothetical protein
MKKRARFCILIKNLPIGFCEHVKKQIFANQQNKKGCAPILTFLLFADKLLRA